MVDELSVDVDVPVSIRAPRCRGARRRTDQAPQLSCQCFNPRSPLPGSASGIKPAAPVQINLFQSSLPVAGERVIIINQCTMRIDCVSILAPRCRGARRAVFMDDGAAKNVSILAPRCRGARRRDIDQTSYNKPFQSSLPVAGERVEQVEIDRQALFMFQSSLPVAGERVH